jgi:transcriptional regulator with XRE-family HTH domain
MADQSTKERPQTDDAACENAAIGKRLHRLRKKHNMTLKELSAETGFSTGFLSQLERGISTIAIDALAKLLKVFNVDLDVFFQKDTPAAGRHIMRSYEQRHVKISPRIIETVLSRKVEEFNFLPRLYHLLPAESSPSPAPEAYEHEGEELIYVLEGVLTLYLDGKAHRLYPGDCAQMHSKEPHNWANETSHIVRFLQINYPNPYLDRAD